MPTIACPAPPSAAPITGPTRPAPMIPTPSRPSRLIAALPAPAPRQARGPVTGPGDRRRGLRHRRRRLRHRRRRLGDRAADLRRGVRRTRRPPTGGCGRSRRPRPRRPRRLRRRRARHPDRGSRAGRSTRPEIVCARMPATESARSTGPCSMPMLCSRASGKIASLRQIAPRRISSASGRSRKPLRFHESGRSERARRGVFVYGSSAFGSEDARARRRAATRSRAGPASAAAARARRRRACRPAARS